MTASHRRLAGIGWLVFLMTLGGVFGMEYVAGRHAHAQESTPLAIVSGDRYPIGLWWPPPPWATAPQWYQEMADAGFTFVIGGNGVVDKFFSQRLLEVAGQVGIDVIVTDQRVTGRTFSSSHPDEERAYLQKVVEDYIQYPAFAGLNFFDEPGTDRYESLSAATRFLESVAPGKLAYVNLFPSYASTGALKASNYEEYVRRFVSEVRPPVLSFDHYPLLLPDGRSSDPAPITEDYFYNWAVIRQVALEAGIPTWVFIQSVDYQNHRLPTEAEILWQVNVSLAYGAKGIMYFTYWTPQSHENFNMALISPQGRRTPLYDYARNTNRYLSVIGKVLLPLTSVSVGHVETPLPRGTAAFQPDEWIGSVEGSAVIIGQFADTGTKSDPTVKGAGERRWVLIVNRSFSGPASVKVTLPSEVGAVFRFEPAEDRYILEPAGQPATLQVDLAPGEAKLYLLTK